MPAAPRFLLILLALALQPVASKSAACAAGDVGFDRPDHDLPGSPFVCKGADACSSACDGTRTCKQWAWNDGKCWLKNLVSPQVAHAGFCSATRTANSSVPERFPMGNFTPYAYLQNPYHRVKHNSGQLRSDDSLNGLGFSGLSVFSIAARPQGLDRSGPVLTTGDEFIAAGVPRSSDLHTKSRFRITWAVSGIDFSAEYWQVAEDVLGCKELFSQAKCNKKREVECA